MHARLSRYAGLPPERIEDTIRQFEADMLAELEQQKGFEGITVAVDWKAGRAAVITYWATAEDLRASAKLAEEARAQAEVTARPSREPIVDQYEVVLRKP
ncbi:MAG: antibiotic biosynthesis monooxygenase family protein [Solirubrobacteraceae bacterium]|jgi:heme-degrading monooxygenase HmoA